MATKYLKRSVDDVIAWSSAQIDHPTQDWFNRCQSHCRQAYGVDVWGYDPVTGSSSAWGAWKQIPAQGRSRCPHLLPRGRLRARHDRDRQVDDGQGAEQRLQAPRPDRQVLDP